jgi:phthiocerol/phenolphthiocerol synthesis type-I polyketide synthase D
VIPADELGRWLVEQVAELCELHCDDIDPRRPFEEYGLSSRDAVELSGGLEELLGTNLPATLLWEYPTIAQLAAGLTGEPGAAADLGPAAPAEDPIAVIGLGCRLPGGVHGPAQFWRLLSDGREAVSEIPPARWADYPAVPPGITRWGGFLDDVAGFDAEFFGITPREAARMDPQQRMVLEVAWEALEHAGIAPASLRGSRTGVFVGISGTEYAALSLAGPAEVDAWSCTGGALAIAANRISYVLDLRGPSMSVDTACSSSLTSVHLAVQSLRSGESEVALAGGANLLLGPGITATFDQMGISSGDGRCKPFSADADGIARAEGAGMVVLKRLSDARADGDRVLAVIRASATNSDGRSNGLTAPNPEAQQALLRTACRQAGVDPADVDYVEAHGTGTLLGDPIEAGALGAVLGTGRPADRPLLLGSVKSNVGHLEAAAGIVGLIKVVLSLRHGRIPASINYAGPNPHIPFDELRLSVVDSPRPWPDRGTPAVAGVSGFGFGGTNAHVLLEQAPAEEAVETGARNRRFLLGAPDSGRLSETAGRLADWLETDGAEVALADIEYTLARRLTGRCRSAVVARGMAELVAGLRSLSRGEQSPSTVTGAPGEGRSGPVFVFSGHGSQWAGMARGLLAGEPAFAGAIERLDPVIRAEAGFSIREDLLSGVDAVTMDHVQPLVFGIQVALAELWRSYGVAPAAVIGHSFGEVAAAVVAGALDEADGAKIVALRSRLLASLAGDGAMALLELGAEETGELVAGLSDVDIAVLSAPNQTVVAGRADQVGQLVSDVDSRGLLAKLVKLDVAAHSPIVDRVTGTLIAGLGELRINPLAVSFYSTASADPRRSATFDAAYWAKNLRQPVRFAGAVDAALADGYGHFVEISPHPVLRHALTANITARCQPGTLVLSTLRDCPDETMHFHTQLAALEIAAETTPQRGEGGVTELPTTPWRHVRHWLSRSVTPSAPTGEHPLLGTHIELPDGDKHVWRSDLRSAARPWLSGPRVDGPSVLNAPAYLEMANAAARTVFGTPAERISLHALTLHQPLSLEEHTPVTTTLTVTGSDSATVTVHSKHADRDWLLHARTDIAVSPRPLLDTFLSELDEPALDAISADRRLRAVVKVSPPEAAGRDPRLRLHPALTDSCLRVLAETLLDPEGDQRYLHVPIEFGTVRVYGDPAQGERIHASVTSLDAAATGLTGALHLVDGAGRVLLAFEDVVIRRIVRDEPAVSHTGTRNEPSKWHGLERLRTVRADQARMMAGEQLHARIASVLGFTPERLNTEVPLTELGVDSLLAVRIRNAVHHDFDVSLPVSLLLRGASVIDTEHWLCSELGMVPELDTTPALPRPQAPVLIGPRDGAERLVTQAWAEVLGGELGVTQDFYAVGGDHERAELITALLVERSGREFTVSELFEHPTIERMAGHVRGHGQNGSPIRVLRQHGAGLPLFFFHPAGGDTAVYRQLGQLIEADIPIYGLDRHEGASTVEAKANQYLPHLRMVQPQGPYRLAGWSYGGQLAFETAQQLRKTGEAVEVVALIDSILPLPNTSGLSDVALLARRLKRFGEFLEATYGSRIDLPYERLARLDDEGQVELLVGTLRESGLVNAAVSEAILDHQRTSFLDARALERYRPERYDGRVVLFGAADVAPGGLADERFDRRDPARGWDEVCTDLELITIPGHHLSLLDPPNVEHIAAQLDGLLAGTRRLVGTGTQR